MNPNNMNLAKELFEKRERYLRDANAISAHLNTGKGPVQLKFNHSQCVGVQYIHNLGLDEKEINALSSYVYNKVYDMLQEKVKEIDNKICEL